MSSNGGLSTGIHAFCDALDHPLGFHLTPGQACDPDGADILIGVIEADTLLADKGCDADARVLERIDAAEIEPVIAPKSNRKQARASDKALCKARHLFENVFAGLKHHRAMATPTDKPATAFRGAIHLAASVIWLN